MSDSTPTKVRCQDCGFLTMRERHSRALLEVEESVRKTGTNPNFGVPAFIRSQAEPHPAEILYVTQPICFVQAANLYAEAKEMSDDAGAKTNLLVMTSERDCAKFTKWQQGYSPREHKAMLDSKEQQRWNDERLEKDRRRQEEQRALDRQWQVAQKWSDRKWHLFMVLLAALFTVLGWFIGKGTPKEPVININVPAEKPKRPADAF